MSSKNLLGIIFMFFIFASCNKTIVEPITEPPSEIIDTTSYKFLALGDSYTIGQGVEESESWPYQLKEELMEREYTISECQVIAKTGWTTQNLIDRLEVEKSKDYDLVSLLIGVNDQYQGSSFESFKNRFDILLDKSIELAKGKNQVMVVSIPDYGVTPFGSTNSENIAMELDEYNSYMESECINLDIPFINITEISRMLGDSENALASDQLHPSAYQYGQWVIEILPIAEGILGE